jgi:hypothetical protein
VNPYEGRKLARRLHEDRAKRIETILIRLASNGVLDGVGTVDRPEHAVLSKHNIWCDAHGEIHSSDGDPYGDHPDDCKPYNWRSVFVQSDDPDEEF